jgi:hypothetical protein
MQDINPNYINDVFHVTLETNWLNSNGELPICLVQPTLVPLQMIIQDESRPESIALASKLFSNDSHNSKLATWFNGDKGLLVFPEYSFGSKDFTNLNQLICSYPYPIIVLAGFGAVRGNDLIRLLSECEPTWPDGITMIDPQAKYNAGWCWTHLNTGNTKCYIFLKNFPEQRYEISLLPELATGKSIFRIETNDLILYPLICADLICDQSNSARERIDKTLPRLQNNQADINKQVLITALLYTPDPHHGLWKCAINDVVSLHNRRAGLCTVNQLLTDCQTDSDKDAWRSLTGGFINKHIMSDRPSPILSSVHYISTDSASGLILRESFVGVACGRFRWVNGADLGRGVWVPNVRKIYKEGELQECNDSIECIELKRYLRRKRNLICQDYDSAIKPLIENGLNEIIKEENNKYLSPRLWAKLLTGIEENPSHKFDIEKIDDESASIDRALGVLAAIQQITGASPIEGPSYRGQLKYSNAELMVWKAPRDDWKKMEHNLQLSSIKHSTEPQLIVLGSGCRGQDCQSKKIIPDRFTDITECRKPGSDIETTRYRHIFWHPLGEFEDILMESNTTLDQKRVSINKKLIGD